MPSLIQYIGRMFEAPGSANSKKTGELITKRGKVKPKIVVYTANTGGNPAFESPDYDWEQIRKAFAADAWLNQAFLKYKELLWKEGYYLKGQDPTAVLYLKKRFQILGLAQGRAMDDILADVSDSLIRYHNAFLVKARDDKPYALVGMKLVPVAGSKPVGGYFLCPVESMLIKVDKNGNVIAYQQNLGGIITDFKPEDVIHFTYDRQPGTQWGHPWAFTVLEDLRSLRLMEEDMLNVYHKEVTPVYTYKIGGEDGRYMVEQEDIDAAQEQVREMHDVGAIVMPGSDSLDVIGSNNKSLDIAPYIEHWRSRVISGFGLAEHQLGITSNASKTGAQAMDSALYDKLKSYQTSLENAITLEILFELLLEGGFTPFNASGDDQMVNFEFKEIDLESRVKIENHISVLWLQNMITHGQMREMLGLEVDPEHSEEYHLDMIELPLTEASKTITGPEGGANPNSPAKGTAGSKNNPANQKGNRGGPKLKAAAQLESLVHDLFSNKNIYKRMTAITNIQNTLIYNNAPRAASFLFCEELKVLSANDNLSQSSKEYINKKVLSLIPKDDIIEIEAIVEEDPNKEFLENIIDIEKRRLDILELSGKERLELEKNIASSSNGNANNDILLSLLHTIANKEQVAPEVSVVIEEGAIQLIQPTPSGNVKRFSKFITDADGKIIGKEEEERSE